MCLVCVMGLCIYEVVGWGWGGRRNKHKCVPALHTPLKAKRPTFNEQALRYIKPVQPHKLLLGNKPPSPIMESRWAAAVPESVQMGQ